MGYWMNWIKHEKYHEMSIYTSSIYEQEIKLKTEFIQI